MCLIYAHLFWLQFVIQNKKLEKKKAPPLKSYFLAIGVTVLFTAIFPAHNILQVLNIVYTGRTLHLL
jgi:hypothetical protein